VRLQAGPRCGCCVREKEPPPNGVGWSASGSAAGPAICSLPAPTPPVQGHQPVRIGFLLNGRFQSARSARDLLVKVFTELANGDATFLGSSGNRVGSWKDMGGSQGSPLLCKEGRGEVDILPAYTNQVPPARPSLWMPLPLPASLTKGRKLNGAHTKV
jgi:hypothetical protein